MANEYQEFLRNYRSSYIMIPTDKSEVLRPFFITEHREEGLPGEMVSGYLLHEPSSKEKREMRTTTSSTKYAIPWAKIRDSFKVITPESISVNLPDVCVYLDYVPRRQFIKGWAPTAFRTTILWGGISQHRSLGVALFDTNMEVSYHALIHNREFCKIEEAIALVTSGERASAAFSRNFAVGSIANVQLPVLYHRGVAKGVLIKPNCFEVQEDCMKFKDLFNRRYGFELIAETPGQQQVTETPLTVMDLPTEQPNTEGLPVERGGYMTPDLIEPFRPLRAARIRT